ncbi:hypothetical protein BGZ82_004680, partial [Podila clonocystis]
MQEADENELEVMQKLRIRKKSAKQCIAGYGDDSDNNISSSESDSEMDSTLAKETVHKDGNGDSRAGCTSVPTYDLNTIYLRSYLKLLVRQRRVILQDSAVLKAMGWSNHLLQDPIFKTREYKEYAQLVLDGLSVDEEPSRLDQCEAAIPEVATEMKSMRQGIDELNAAVRSIHVDQAEKPSSGNGNNSKGQDKDRTQQLLETIVEQNRQALEQQQQLLRNLEQ